MNVIADNYFVVLDRLEEKTDRLERKILNEFSDKLAEKILQLKGACSFEKRNLSHKRSQCKISK